MRFTIRDLLWLTVVAAVAICWYRDRMLMAKTIEQTRADIAAEKAAERAVDKAKLQRELSLTEFVRNRSQEAFENVTRMLSTANDAHRKEVARLNERIYRLEGPGYADQVEPTEVAGMGIEWWADRAKFFERKYREAKEKGVKPSSPSDRTSGP